MILGYPRGVRGVSEGQDASALRRIYQVDSPMPSLSATTAARTALRRSKVSSGILRRVGRDDRTIVAMGNGDLRNRLFQTMFPSPYDTQIHDWGRGVSTDFLEPAATAALAGSHYAGGGALGGYPIAMLEGYKGLGDFAWAAPRVISNDRGTFTIEDPDEDTWTAYYTEFKVESFRWFFEDVGTDRYLVVEHGSGKRVYVPSRIAKAVGFEATPAAVAPPKKKKTPAPGEDRSQAPPPPPPPPPSAGVFDRVKGWLVANQGMAAVVMAGVVAVWFVQRRTRSLG